MHYKGLQIRIIKTALKLLTCLLYVIRVMIDTGPIYANWYIYIIYLNSYNLKFLIIIHMHNNIKLWVSGSYDEINKDTL